MVVRKSSVLKKCNAHMLEDIICARKQMSFLLNVTKTPHNPIHFFRNFLLGRHIAFKDLKISTYIFKAKKQRQR